MFFPAFSMSCSLEASMAGLHRVCQDRDPDNGTHRGGGRLPFALPGIGDWTARIYLLFSLGRPDVWPAGDVGLHAAYHRLASLAERPSAAELTAIAEARRPWRSVAARLLWHYYDRVKVPV
jgi:hypothetical protein